MSGAIPVAYPLASLGGALDVSTCAALGRTGARTEAPFVAFPSSVGVEW